MLVGQIGVVTTKNSYMGHVVLRVFDTLVSLTDPVNTWTPLPPFEVELLPPGTEVTYRICK